MGKDVIYKTILADDLKDYIISCKDAYNSGNSFILQPKTGALKLNFKDENLSFAIIKFKRRSGNGLVMVSSSCFSKDYQINSKIEQGINHNIGKDGLLTIHRTNRSRGEVSFSEIVLYKSEMSVEEWNTELKKAEDYSCLRFIDNSLFASSGGYIIGSVSNIKTDPENAYIRDNNYKIRFLTSCKIVELNISGERKTPQNPVVEVFDKPIQEEITKSLPVKFQKINEETEFLIYDTDTEGFSFSYCKNGAIIEDNGMLLLNFTSEYTIPLSVNLDTGSNIKVKVEACKKDGNGKLVFGIYPGGNNEKSIKITSKVCKTFIEKINSLPYSENYTIKVGRPLSSKGFVYIKRIIVYSDSVTSKVKAKNYLQSFYNVENSSQEVLYVDNITNNILAKSLSFSNIVNHNYLVGESEINNSELIIDINTYHGRLWFSRIKPFIPNVKIKTVEDNVDVSISHVNNLIPAKTMFIDGYFSSLTEKSLEILNAAENVLVSPKIDNSVITGIKSNIIRTNLILPQVKSAKDLLFSECRAVVVDNWPDENQKVQDIVSRVKSHVAVLNARGSYSSNTIPVNEYLSFDKISSIISNSSIYIDIDGQDEYLDLAKSYKNIKKIITDIEDLDYSYINTEVENEVNKLEYDNSSFILFLKSMFLEYF